MSTLPQESSQTLFTYLRGVTVGNQRDPGDETTHEVKEVGKLPEKIHPKVRPVVEKKDQTSLSNDQTSSLEERVVVLEKLVDSIGAELHGFRIFVEAMIGRQGGDA